MNKKKVSVVMAGAMLASSVAPVLAAETTTNEVSQGKMGLLIDRLETLMDSKKFDSNDRDVNGNESKVAGKSVYAVQILKDGKTEITGTDLALKISDKKTVNVFTSDSASAKLKELASNFDGAKFYTVNVYEIGNTTDANGRIVSIAASSKDEIKIQNYDSTRFANLLADAKAVIDGKKATNYGGINDALTKNWITEFEVSEDEKEVTVVLGSKDAEGKFNKVKCAVGTPELKFSNPVDKLGNLLTGKEDTYIQANIAGFEAFNNGKVPAGTLTDITAKNAKIAHTVKVVNGDVNYTLNVNDLYDGFMLTEKGHQLMNAIKEYNEHKNFAPNNSTEVDKNGTERSFTITFYINNTKHVVKVVGDSLHEGRIKTLKSWLYQKKANVELLAGENRYATAVEIAKTYLAGESQYHDKDGVYGSNTELVLVNGNALVDGLAAAPYAKAKGAPILLTSTDKLPTETKTFMKELIAKHSIGSLNNKDLTVTIVGGHSVVSNSVAQELESYGFKVKRISGDNREETSLAVADKLADLKTTKKAFVVGANGEADAMSIAAAAAKEGTPIIVSKSDKGLSTVGVNEVSEYDEVEIVGGEGVVPKSTEEAIVKLIDKENVTRLDGKNRFETNALVIKKYHKNFTDALIAKDGQRNKSELVDALPAAIFASSNAATNPAAPIVLATDKISDEQLNQLVLNSNKSDKGTVYQIGNGVARSVMEKVVTKLGLNN